MISNFLKIRQLWILLLATKSLCKRTKPEKKIINMQFCSRDKEMVAEIVGVRSTTAAHTSNQETLKIKIHCWQNRKNFAFKYRTMYIFRASLQINMKHGACWDGKVCVNVLYILRKQRNTRLIYYHIPRHHIIMIVLGWHALLSSLHIFMSDVYLVSRLGKVFLNELFCMHWSTPASHSIGQQTKLFEQ